MSDFIYPTVTRVTEWKLIDWDKLALMSEET